MNAELIEDWLKKAEENYRVALRENRHTKYPAYDTVCFNAQQCAEKYLKAFLVRNQVDFPKIHDLDELRQLCESVDATFGFLVKPLDSLYRYAVDVRYPGFTSTKEDARSALEAMKQVPNLVRARLGLK